MPDSNGFTNSPDFQFPLLRTKLIIPPLRDGTIPRPRLVARLSSANPLTLLSAPAGYGKTTALCEWIHADQDAAAGCAWLSLDERDNDLGRFVRYLAAAVESTSPGFGEPLSGLLGADQRTAPEMLLAVLVNALVEIKPPLVIVLDNYQDIHLPAIHQFLGSFLEYLPPGVRVMISTRVDPPFPLARMRGTGKLSELRAADLRFTDSEIEDFFARSLTEALEEKQLSQVAERTEGWPASLQMLLLALQRKPNAAEFIDSFSGGQEYIAGYFTDEVLAVLPDHIRSFLLRTCILEQLSAPLCRAVSGNEDSGEVLRYLDDGNLFVSRVDGAGEWFRYHRLFSELLRQKLKIERPEEMSELYANAARWCWDEGLHEQAVEYAIAAGKFDQAAAWISTQLAAIWQQGLHSLLVRWGEMIPEETWGAFPEFSIYLIRTKAITGKIAEAQSALVRSGLLEVELEPKLLGMRSVVEAMLALYRGDFASAVDYAERAIDHLPESCADWRASAYVMMGVGYGWLGDLQASTQAYAQAVSLGHGLKKVYFSLDAAFRLATNQYQLGHLAEAESTCKQELAFAESASLGELPAAGTLWALLGAIYLQRNQMDLAEEAVARGKQIAEQGSDIVAVGYCYINLLNLLFSKGDTNQVEAVIAQLEKLTGNSPLPGFLAHWVTASKIKLHTLRGEIEPALRLAAPYQLDKDFQVDFSKFEIYMAYLRLVLAQTAVSGEERLLEHGLALIVKMIAKVSREGLTNKYIQLLLFKVRFLLQQGDKTRGLAVLADAVELAEKEGFVRLFVDEGQVIRDLLPELQSDGAVTSFVQRLLRAFGPNEQAAKSRQGVEDGLLTRREMEVLRYLPSHLNEVEISEELCVARSTVHSHIKSIYQKLNAHNRSEAVERARAMKLL